jgi:hypothetical protein
MTSIVAYMNVHVDESKHLVVCYKDGTYISDMMTKGLQSPRIDQDMKSSFVKGFLGHTLSWDDRINVLFCKQNRKVRHEMRDAIDKSRCSWSVLSQVSDLMRREYTFVAWIKSTQSYKSMSMRGNDKYIADILGTSLPRSKTDLNSFYNRVWVVRSILIPTNEGSIPLDDPSLVDVEPRDLASRCCIVRRARGWYR